MNIVSMISLFLLFFKPISVKTRKFNVLFIAIDDLRPMLNGLGVHCAGMDVSREDGCSYMSTPHLDTLMKDSLYLLNSHVQFAECAPSRASILFGRRPDTTHVYDLITNSRNVGCANCTTIPGLFKEAGYFTVGMGKIFHGGPASEGMDPQSWSRPDIDAGKHYFSGYDNGPGQCRSSSYGGPNSWLSVNETETGPCQDSQVRDHALNWMDKLVRGDIGSQPWFLGVGFHKPHLPFVAPHQFFELYPKGSPSTFQLAPNPFAPVDMPAVAYASSELQGYGDVKATGFEGKINETLEDSKAMELVRAYKAAVSYTDYNVGQLVQRLKDLDQWNKTIIVCWGDHGWKLGHHGAWGKQTNFQEDTNSPLLIRIPGLTDGGSISNALVEHVDIMPTLAEAAKLEPLTQCADKDPWVPSRCTEGTSFMPLIYDSTLRWKNASFSQYPRTHLTKTSRIMGYSMKLEDSRFTAWVKFDTVSNTTEFDMSQCRKCGLELYDHIDDPLENHNLAYRQELSALVKLRLSQLKAGWRATCAGLENSMQS